MDDELQNRKLQAEIEKLQTETLVIRRQRWSVMAEWLKATGAIAATLLALYAASATYRVTQLETRAALVDKKEAEEKRAAAVAAKNAAVVAKNEAERELAALLIRVQTAQDALSKLQTASSTPALSKSLRAVSGGLEEASRTAEQVLPYVLVVPAVSAQNQTAATLAELLREQGVRSGVNEPLRKPENGPSVVEVHYFKPTEREEAERILKLLSTASVSGRVVPRFNRNMPRLRYYELRLPLGLELTSRTAG